MEISYDDFIRLSKELTDKEVCINQLRNDLNATRKELESEKLQNSALCEENSALKAQCVKSEFENSVLRKYILLSKEKIAEFVGLVKDIKHWTFLRAFVLWALPEEYRELEMRSVDEVMGLPQGDMTSVVLDHPTFHGPMYDVHGNSDVEINR